MPTPQEFTFFLSWGVQLAVLVTSVVAMAAPDIPDTLLLILALETGVQGIEFIWYSGVAALYVFGPWCGTGASIDVGYRYLDWMITTPLMLVSLMFFALWEVNRCVRTEDLLGADVSRVIALVVLIVMDLCMLLVGSAYANRNAKGGTLGQAWDNLALFLDEISFFGEDPTRGIFLGWIPFLGAFAPLLVMMATDRFKVGGLVSISVSAVAWAVYGVIAVSRYYDPKGNGDVWTAATANTLYNLMDIVSKNVMGVVVSAVVFTGDYSNTTLNCTVVDGRPYEWSLITNGTVD